MFGLGASLVDVPDEDLVELARTGEDRAIDVLLNRYRNFARVKARTYFLAGADREDIVQEGMIGLESAPFVETIVGSQISDPAELVVSAEALERIKSSMGEVLSSLETDVLRLYMDGKTYLEIADILGRHVKSIDNALQRIKKKLEEHLDRSARGAG